MLIKNVCNTYVFANILVHIYLEHEYEYILLKKIEKYASNKKDSAS